MKSSAYVAIAIILAVVFAFMGAGSAADINMLRGCTDGQVAAWDATNSIWDCTSAGAGSAITFDIGDDSGNDSIDLKEIATTGDSNTIFTEPAADKMLITVGNNWPTSDNADAFSADPANCTAGQTAGGVTAAGVAESCLDPITETELDAEVELETQLADVTDVFTDNDGALDDDDVSDDSIASLSDVTIAGGSSGELLIHDGVDSWDDKAMSGDCTINASGVIECTEADALEANGANCSASQAPLGVDASGAVEGCWGPETETHASDHASGGADLLYGEREAVWQQTGDVSTAMEIENIRLYTRQSGTIIDAFCSVNTAGTTDAIVIDFNKNGATIFTTQANRVQIAAAANYDASGGPDVTSYSANDYFTIEIDQADTGDTGADLSCQLQVKEAVTQ